MILVAMATQTDPWPQLEVAIGQSGQAARAPPGDE